MNECVLLNVVIAVYQSVYGFFYADSCFLFLSFGLYEMMCLCLPFLGISIFLGRLRLRQRLYFNHFYNLLWDFILHHRCSF